MQQRNDWNTASEVKSTAVVIDTQGYKKHYSTICVTPLTFISDFSVFWQDIRLATEDDTEKTSYNTVWTFTGLPGARSEISGPNF